MKEEPKFVKLERKYLEEYKTPALEERKKTLELRRNMNQLKPLSQLGLNEHKEKYR